MRFISRARRALAAAALVFAAGAAQAADPAAVALAELIKPMLIAPGEGAASWEQVGKAPGIRWGQGPLMLDKASPDGNFFARPGQASLLGRNVGVVASGARTLVFSVYVRDTAPPMAPDALADGLRQAGFGVALARCPLDPQSAAPRRWYRLTAAKRKTAFFYAGPLQSGGSGYTLFLDDLPAMTQTEARLYTDDCAAPGKATAGVAATRPVTGQAGVVAVIEALMRPVGAASVLPWTTLASLPVVSWRTLTPMKMASPWTDGGVDDNPRLLEGEFRTATTRMTVIATGGDRGANRFSLRDGGNLPRGAVFEGLMRDGYTISAQRCGKPYTQMTDSFYRISGPGKQPAILYRKMNSDAGTVTETYGLRLDNVLPALVPGQTPPVGGRCPG